MRQSASIILLLSIFIGCNHFDDFYDTSNPILVKAYSSDYTYPVGFYHEIIDSGSIYYNNTLSIKPLDERGNEIIDLSCNDLDQARIWSELTDLYSSYHLFLESERETKRFYEFKWVSPINRRDMILSRVHKESYFKPLLNRAKSHFVSGSPAADTIGQISITNFQDTDIKELIEYMWSSGIIGLPEKVDISVFTDTSLVYRYLIKSISLIGGDFHINDSVFLYGNNFTINKSDGFIMMNRKLIDSFKGKVH